MEYLPRQQFGVYSHAFPEAHALELPVRTAEIDPDLALWENCIDFGTSYRYILPLLMNLDCSILFIKMKSAIS